MSDPSTPRLTIPEGFALHTEQSAHILLPSDNEAFLNTVQEFNRDLSVACIRTWSEEFNQAKEKKWRAAQVSGRGKGRPKTKRPKSETHAGEKTDTVIEDVLMKVEPPAPESVVEQEALVRTAEEPSPKVEGESSIALTSTVKLREYTPHRFVLLEPLSATGIRAIRFAKEIPLVKYVIANDLSSSAVEAIKRNVELNDLGPREITPQADEPPAAVQDGQGSKAAHKSANGSSSKNLGKVRINEGDACALMYSHLGEHHRVDCVDLDPYGTAAPFIDAAVQCINHDGLLCVTCTDLSVLATNNYPEKCYSNYGGVPVKAEYCHEVALRLVLHTISTSAARYGRYIQPLLSLSIDFYVRLFVKIGYQPIEVKKAASKTSTYYVCANCQSFYDQPLGKMVERVSGKTGQTNLVFKQRSGPPVGDRCPECDSPLHLAGPMWNGPIHDTEFASKVLDHVEASADKYGTAVRMKGMLTVAKEELHTPFYFSPGKIAGLFHCISPSLEDVASALLNEGHSVSRSHAMAGSLKTTATRQDVHDIFRGWILSHPVKPESISPSSPSHHLHAKEARFQANFKRHPQSVTQSSKVKVVRYQPNPTTHWGPGTKAKSKRKRDDRDE